MEEFNLLPGNAYWNIATPTHSVVLLIRTLKVNKCHQPKKEILQQYLPVIPTPVGMTMTPITSLSKLQHVHKSWILFLSSPFVVFTYSLFPKYTYPTCKPSIDPMCKPCIHPTCKSKAVWNWVESSQLTWGSSVGHSPAQFDFCGKHAIILPWNVNK